MNASDEDYVKLLRRLFDIHVRLAIIAAETGRLPDAEIYTSRAQVYRVRMAEIEEYSAKWRKSDG
jgi:hypothetical protein